MADKSFGVKELNLLNASGTPTVTSPNNLNLNANTVAISTSATVGNNLTVTSTTNSANLNVTGIGTLTRGFATDLSVSGISTIAQPADSNPMANWTITNNSASAYRFTGPGQSGTEDNPNIYLVRGHRYIFRHNATSSHPIQIRVSNGGSAYTDGITYSEGNNTTTDGNNLIFNVQHDAPAQLYYQCTSHGGMVGNIYIVGGPQVISGVVTATTFVGNLTGNVTGTASANAVLTGSTNDTLVTVTGANAIQGESTLTYNGSGTLEITDSGSSYTLRGAGVVKHGIDASSSDNDLVIQNNKTAQNVTSNIIFKGSGSGGASVSEKLRIASNGNVGIGTDNPQKNLDIYSGQSHGSIRVHNLNNGSTGYDAELSLLGSASNSEMRINMGVNSDPDREQIKSYQSNLIFTTANNERIRVTNGGLDPSTDAVTDLGNSSKRYRDLYVSGGVVFDAVAGNATSNTLDDYEEGSWTPNIRNTGTTATWTSQTGKYVKIGQQVTVWFNADGGSSPRSGGTSSSLIMTGLPFNQSIFGNPILGSVGANKSSGTGLYSTIGVILSPFGQGGTQVRFGVGGQPINFGIDYVAGSFTYTAAS